jgi:hypothetical protein
VELFEIRRLNAVKVMQENALDELSFALCLGKDEEHMVDILAQSEKGHINDALARLMEQTFSKPKLWLDQMEQEGTGPSFDLFG